jgi:peroxiredoxin
VADEQGAIPEVGEQAPDFTLEAFTAEGMRPITLSSFRGQANVVLAFYVLDWTSG